MKKFSLDMFFLAEIRIFLLPHIYVVWDKRANIGIYASMELFSIGIRINGFFVAVPTF